MVPALVFVVLIVVAVMLGWRIPAALTNYPEPSMPHVLVRNTSCSQHCWKYVEAVSSYWKVLPLHVYDP